MLAVRKGKRYELDWSFTVSLQAGSYNIASVMSIPIDLMIGKVEFCDFVPCALQFSVDTPPDEHVYGYVHWQNEVQILEYQEKDDSWEEVMKK